MEFKTTETVTLHDELLLQACENDNWNQVIQLLSIWDNNYPCGFLHMLALKAPPHILGFALEKAPQKDLHYAFEGALERGDWSVLGQTLGAKCHEGVCRKIGWLHAARSGNMDVVHLVSNLLIDIDSHTIAHHSALEEACRQENMEMAEYFVAVHNVDCTQGLYALGETGNLEMLKKLHQKFQFCPRYIGAAVTAACRRGQMSIIKEFHREVDMKHIRRGIRLALSENQQEVLQYFAAVQGYSFTTEQLVGTIIYDDNSAYQIMLQYMSPQLIQEAYEELSRQDDVGLSEKLAELEKDLVQKTQD